MKTNSATARETLKEIEQQDLLCRQAICDAYDLGCDGEVAELKQRLREIRQERQTALRNARAEG